MRHRILVIYLSSWLAACDDPAPTDPGLGARSVERTSTQAADPSRDPQTPEGAAGAPGAQTPGANLGALGAPAEAQRGDDLTEAIDDGDESDEDDDDGAGLEEDDDAESASSPGGVRLVAREGLRLTELVLARAVEARRPVDPGTTFSKAATDKVYCYVRVANPDRVETAVYIGWEPEGQPSTDRGREQSVRAFPEWVTFAFTTTRRRAGRYLCVVRDADGELLGSAPFDLTE